MRLDMADADGYGWMGLDAVECRWMQLAAALQDSSFSRLERETLLIALRYNKPIRPVDLVKGLEINRRTAVNCLKSFCSKGKLRPIVSSKATNVIRRYEYMRSFTDDSNW
jgi:hypothetical protein